MNSYIDASWFNNMQKKKSFRILPLPSSSAPWEKAEAYHDSYNQFSEEANHYSLYADLYLSQGNRAKHSELLAKAQDMNNMAFAVRTLERQAWQNAHHRKLSDHITLSRLRRAFKLMSVMTAVYLAAWACLGIYWVIN